MNWRYKILKKYLKEALFASIFVTIFILVLIIANQFFGWQFDWHQIDPIDLPPIWIRALVSVCTFITIGKLLFESYFYKALYEITRFL